MSYQNVRFRGEFSPGLPKRNDDYFALNLSASYAVDRNWLLRGEYQRVDQKSTISFYSYGRDQLMVKLRYDFK